MFFGTYERKHFGMLDAIAQVFFHTRHRRQVSEYRRKDRMRKSLFVLQMSVLLMCVTPFSPAHAAHPLITDDTGTQGAGKVQIEVNGEYGSDRETASEGAPVSRYIAAVTAISYGLTETVDAVIGVPYVWSKSPESEKGLSDASFEVKWRLYERGGFGLGVKPGLLIPTGSEGKGLGTGKYGSSFYLIASQETGPWALHLNFGHIRSNNRPEERKDLYNISFAAEYGINDPVRIVMNVGEEFNRDRTTDRNPAFALAGLIYGITEDLDIDLGFKAGFSGPETYRTVLAGMAYRF
jgi:hypothetical protein